jgi:hypothetical protein
MRYQTPDIKPFGMLLFAVMAACEPAPELLAKGPVEDAFREIGKLEFSRLDEASGLQAGENGIFFVHNDGGDDIYAIDATGRHLGKMDVKKAKNRDWEDITRVPGSDGPLLVIGDIGNKDRSRAKLRLYFVPEPQQEQFNSDIRAVHNVKLRVPGRPTDLEAMAYDPSSESILFLSKPDQPPLLFRLSLEEALASEELELELLGAIKALRPPTQKDLLTGLNRGLLVSRPTGMDISPDGYRAAVITYRSLYVFEREEGETWLEAFQGEPVEYLGPPGLYDEAVSFSRDGRSIIVTTERRPAPLSQLQLE